MIGLMKTSFNSRIAISSLQLNIWIPCSFTNRHIFVSFLIGVFSKRSNPLKQTQEFKDLFVINHFIYRIVLFHVCSTNACNVYKFYHLNIYLMWIIRLNKHKIEINNFFKAFNQAGSLTCVTITPLE